ncbi:hypothetical protein ABPG74_020187 [Tetrahymena malaccensis]
MEKNMISQNQFLNSDLDLLTEKLSLQIIYDNCEDLNQIVDKLRHFKNLKDLSLQIMNKIKENEFSVMIDAIKEMTTLKSFEFFVDLYFHQPIRGKRVYQEGAKELEQIGQLQNLESITLNFSYFQLQDSDIKYLAQIFKQCVSLKQAELIIPQNITSFGYQELGQSLSETSKLKKLVLKLTVEQCIRLCYLGSGLAKNQTIQDLQIIINENKGPNAKENFTEKGMCKFATSLSKMKQIHSFEFRLNFGDPIFSGNGICKFGTSLAEMSNLQYLKLELSETYAIEQIIDVLKYFQNLRYLLLIGFKVRNKIRLNDVWKIKRLVQCQFQIRQIEEY